MEIEIKIEVSMMAGHAIMEDNLGFSRRENQIIQMSTQYFADLGGILRQNRIMLRMRAENDKSVCCVKIPLTPTARMELEEPAENIAQGVEKLIYHPEMPRNVAEILKNITFFESCGADFVRRQQKCRLGELEFFLCFDSGFVHGKNGKSPICEVELELISGYERELTLLAEKISALYDGQISEISKAQRAFDLA